MNVLSHIGISSILLGGLLLLAQPSHAKRQLDGMLLGITESELQTRFADIHRVRKPSIGPNGLRGLWMLQDTTMSGVPFETTFYLKDKRVSRIEQRWTSAQGSCNDASVFAAIVVDLATKYGTGLAADEPANGETAQQSVVWQTDAFDAMVYQSHAAAECSVLVIYKPHLVKDASEL